MKKFTTSNKGITLIALVVTIIILIILAGISINLLLGDNGIINKARESQKLQDIARIQDKLELEKGDRAIEDKGAPDYEKYLEKLINKGIIDESDIERNEEREESAYVTLEEKYIFLIEKEENGNIKIEYLGEVGNIAPRIESIATSTTSNSVSVTFKLKYTSEYSISIKESTEGSSYEKEEKIKVTDKNISKTFEGLEKLATYNIRIKAYSQNGEVVEKEISITTIEIDELINAQMTFNYNPTGWTNQSVVATAVLADELLTIANENEYEIQTSKDGINWNSEASITCTENGPVYARLYDGKNEYASTTGNVDKIDKEKPTVSGATSTTNSITITATDKGGSNVSGYAVTEANTAPALTDFKEELTITELTPGTTYYAWARDTAGNISETGYSIKTSYPGVESKLKPGDYVKYDSGTNGTITSIVLYNDDKNGLQIVSAGSVTDLTIAGKTGYNDFVATLNTKAGEYVNSTYAASARALGSATTSTATSVGETGTHTSTLSSGMKEADTTYTADLAALEAIGANDIDSEYWMASRYIYTDENGEGYSGAAVDTDGAMMSLCLNCYHTIGTTQEHEYTKGFRPVITLNSSVVVTSGSGTSSDPYVLGTN